MAVPTEQGLILAAILFCLGLVGLLSRRNIVYMLMSVEIMFNAAGLAFIVAGARWAQPESQVMFLIVLSVAAAEVAVGLSLVLLYYHNFKTLDADAGAGMKG